MADGHRCEYKRVGRTTLCIGSRLVSLQEGTTTPG